MEPFENQIDKVREYFVEHKAEEYPINNQLLAEHDEYAKSMYFRMLCALIRYTGNPDEAQVQYVSRLIAGSNAENGFADYMRMALELDIKDVEEFISAFQEDTLKYYFCIDGSILLSVVEADQKNYEMLAELIEMLKITHNELTYLTAVSKAIIMQSTELYDAAKSLSPDTTAELPLIHYLCSFYSGILLDNPWNIRIYSNDKENWDISSWGLPKTDFTAKVVTIENVQGTLPNDIKFKNCSEVVLKNCSFIGNASYFYFENVGRVRIENCTISDFSNRFAVFSRINELIVHNNRFINCGYNCSWYGNIRGGVIWVEKGNVECISIEGNEVNNCYIASTHHESCTAIFYACDYDVQIKTIRVIGNHFSGCQCGDHYNNYTEAYIYVPTKYKPEIIEENNTFSGGITRLFECQSQSPS